MEWFLGPYKWPKINGFRWWVFVHPYKRINGVMSPYLLLVFGAHIVLKNLRIWFQRPCNRIAQKVSKPILRIGFLGGGFKYFLLSPLFGEDFQFDEHIFQMGWNHQPDFYLPKYPDPSSVILRTTLAVQVHTLPLEDPWWFLGKVWFIIP